MLNVKRYINDQIQKSYNHKIEFDTKLLQAIYVGNHGIDYCVKTLIPLGKLLNKTPKELYDILIINLSEFDTFFDRNNLNINLKPEFIMKYLQINNKNIINHKRILCDYSSPNIAKDMHVGHLRSTIIGDSISKLLEYQGYHIIRINHIGDFGTQFGMIIEHLLEKYPNYKDYNLDITDLQKFYAESKKRFDNDTEFSEKAYNQVVKIQNGDKQVVDAWNFIKDISRKSYQDIYDRLNIKNLIECGESFYQPFISDMINELEERGILLLEEGRKIIRVPGFNDIVLTIVKSDGAYTYDTTDLAALKYRLVNLNMDKIIYVTDNSQSVHFEMCFYVANFMDWKRDDQELHHVGFGLVLGQDGKKLKSRAGDTVKLSELLDESVIEAKKIKDALQKERDELGYINIVMSDEEEQEIIKNIAYSSLKYADLSTMRTNNYTFSYKKMLNLKGNSGSYLLYEYTRIVSILKKAGININPNNIIITEKEEINVCKQILLFQEIIESVAEDLMLHRLCGYLYNLTNAFSVFHTKCRCLHYNEVNELVSIDENRIGICLITKKILEICFDILGIVPVRKM